MTDHGLLSLLPPLVALALALWSKNVVLSLALGVFAGFLVLAGADPLAAAYASLEQGLFGQLARRSHASLIVLVLIIGGFVGLLEASGGLRTFAQRIAGWVRGAVGAQLAVWLAGIAIFFSDSATPLILGPIFRPVLERSGVSREKLAYIIDATASPVCVLVPFISWGVYTMSLYDQAHRQLGLVRDAFTTFLEVLPLTLYPLLTLLAVPLIILSRRELGPMVAAQRALGQRSIEPSGDASDDVDGGDEADRDDKADRDDEAQAEVPLSTVVIPLAVLALSVGSLFVRSYLVHGKLGGLALKSSLTISYLLATATALWVCRRVGVLTLSEGLGAFKTGVQRMLVVPLILILAWSLGHACKSLGTGRYLARLTRPVLTPGLLSPALFVVAAVISFAMGSAWGTFAILLPIGAALARGMGIALQPAFGAVLSGGLFGDHASPISDTTILASMGAGCEHIEHVRTQLPYALIVAAISLGGFYLAGRGVTPTLVLGLGALTLLFSLGALLWRFGSSTLQTPRSSSSS
jgi:Na+/H+ antiporter NhaC